jgi:hypothetical protein
MAASPFLLHIAFRMQSVCRYFGAIAVDWQGNTITTPTSGGLWLGLPNERGDELTTRVRPASGGSASSTPRGRPLGDSPDSRP